ncbi:MAG: hypothetical protein J7L15_03270 [Clostridiales bacterium]|nr:hypothetical protein [Clostridiales bacterium]
MFDKLFQNTEDTFLKSEVVNKEENDALTAEAILGVMTPEPQIKELPTTTDDIQDILNDINTLNEDDLALLFKSVSLIINKEKEKHEYI